MTSTLVLLVTYLFTAFAAICFAGTGTDGPRARRPETAGDVLATSRRAVLGAGPRSGPNSPSACRRSAPCSPDARQPRATLSMGAHGALPAAFARIHPTYRTPAFATVFFGAPPPSC